MTSPANASGDREVYRVLVPVPELQAEPGDAVVIDPKAATPFCVVKQVRAEAVAGAVSRRQLRLIAGPNLSALPPVRRRKPRPPTPAVPKPTDPLARMSVMGLTRDLTDWGIARDDQVIYDPAGPAIYGHWRALDPEAARQLLREAKRAGILTVLQGELPPCLAPIPRADGEVRPTRVGFLRIVDGGAAR